MPANTITVMASTTSKAWKSRWATVASMSAEREGGQRIALRLGHRDEANLAADPQRIVRNAAREHRRTGLELDLGEHRRHLGAKRRVHVAMNAREGHHGAEPRMLAPVDLVRPA